VVKLVGRDAVIDKLVYTATNPVADHLVDRAPLARTDWPGGPAVRADPARHPTPALLPGEPATTGVAKALISVRASSLLRKSTIEYALLGIGVALTAACAQTAKVAKYENRSSDTSEGDRSKPETRSSATATVDRTKVIDGSKLAVRIRDRASTLGVRVTNVSCPSDIIDKPGVKLSCQVEIDYEKSYIMDVTVIDLDRRDGGSHLEATWHDGVAVRVADLESHLRERLRQTIDIAINVVCGDEPLRFLDAQRRLRCDVAIGEAAATMMVEFDDHVVPTNWKVEPPIIVSAQIAKIMTPIVRAKTNHGVELDCGPKAAYVRPSDGILWCTLTDGAKRSKLRIDLDERINPQSWGIVPAP
jgi:hypothetical protein